MNNTASAGLAALRSRMIKTYGAAISRQDSGPVTYDVISTGSLSLDYATVVGGYVVGRIALLWGTEGVGKTTMAMKTLAAAQQQYPDRAVGYIDMEQTFDFDWARAQGLDTSEKRLMHVYPDNSEDVADMLKMMTSSGHLSQIVVDSIGGMETKAGFEKDAGESNMGKNAQVITRMCKAAAVNARKYGVSVVLISQVRADFKNMTGLDTYAGPKMLRHALTQRIKFSRTGTPQLKLKIDGQEVPVGTEIRAKVERSKVGPEGYIGTFVILNQSTEQYGPVGLDRADEAVALGGLTGVLIKRGAWFDLPDGSSHNGRDAVKAYLRQNPGIVDDLRESAIKTRAAQVISDGPSVQFTSEEQE